uniref:Histone H2A C-terminal domain-containing protein n=1 Tax=Seriola dumerili TaxID=41447 RepID=A0A3B4VA73_SERDU
IARAKRTRSSRLTQFPVACPPKGYVFGADHILTLRSLELPETPPSTTRRPGSSPPPAAVTIAQGGVLPNIRRLLLPKKTEKPEQGPKQSK